MRKFFDLELQELINAYDPTKFNCRCTLDFYTNLNNKNKMTKTLITDPKELRIGDRVACKIGRYDVEGVLYELDGRLMLKNNNSESSHRYADQLTIVNLNTKFGGSITDMYRFQGAKTLRDVQVGDILVDSDGDYRAVLGTVGEMVFLSGWTTNRDLKSPTLKTFNYVRTFYELEELGFTIYEPESEKEEILELTIPEIAEKYNVKPENVRIKDESEEE